MVRVLMVLTGAKTWTMKNGSLHPTGSRAEEFTPPHEAFTEAGFEIAPANPLGVKPTVGSLVASADGCGVNVAAPRGQPKMAESIFRALERHRGYAAARTRGPDTRDRLHVWICLLPRCPC